MTKNSYFKKEVRAYQQIFGTTYTEALEHTNQSFVITPDMKETSEEVLSMVSSDRPGIILISGSVCSGKTILQWYLQNQVADNTPNIVPYLGDDYDEMGKISESYKTSKSTRLVEFSTSSTAELTTSEIYHVLPVRPGMVSVSELRQPSQAEHVLQFSTSGHTTISNIHASSVPDAVIRFYHLLLQTKIFKTEGEANELLNQIPLLIVDVNRVRVGRKSFIVTSNYVFENGVMDVLEPNGIKNWMDRTGYVKSAERAYELYSSLK